MNIALESENRSIGKLESYYLRNKAGQTYLACEDMNFMWTRQQVKDFRILWDEGRNIDELARYFGRPQEEILIIALDLGMKNRIKPRKGGLLGEMPIMQEKYQGN